MCERSAVSALSMIELRTGLRDFECGSAGVLSARHDQAKTRPCKCGLVQNLQNLVWCGEGGRSRGFMGHSIEGLCPPLLEHCVLLWPLPLSVRASICAADRGEGHDLVIVLFDFPTLFRRWRACLRPMPLSWRSVMSTEAEHPAFCEDGCSGNFLALPSTPPGSSVRWSTVQRAFHGVRGTFLTLSFLLGSRRGGDSHRFEISVDLRREAFSKGV